MSPPPQNKDANAVPKRSNITPESVLARLSPQPDDVRPTLFFFAGPNGAGKSSLFELARSAVGPIDFINADLVARTLVNAPEREILAQKLADVMREHFLAHHQTFATETVFSDPRGAKLDYLRKAQEQGYRVVVVGVGIASPALSAARVKARVLNGGHAVPLDKLPRRYFQCLANLKACLEFVEHAILFDNSGERAVPIAVTARGTVEWTAERVPPYLESLLPNRESGAGSPGN